MCRVEVTEERPSVIGSSLYTGDVSDSRIWTPPASVLFWGGVKERTAALDFRSRVLLMQTASAQSRLFDRRVESRRRFLAVSRAPTPLLRGIAKRSPLGALPIYYISMCDNISSIYTMCVGNCASASGLEAVLVVCCRAVYFS